MRRGLISWGRTHSAGAFGSLANKPFELVAVLILIGWIAAALLRPIIAYDDWYYHLPFSARLWDIGRVSGSFHFDRHLELRWTGFPLLWEWLQGLAWSLTGDIRSTIAPQLILCGAYFALISRKLTVRWHLLVLGFFASPMLLIHFQAAYVDLPAGLCLAIGFFLLIRQIHVDRPSTAETIGAILFLGMAGNIKVQALISAALIGLAVIGIALAQLGFANRTGRVALVSAIAVSLSCATAIADAYRTGNPLYPMKVAIGETIVFAGPEDPMHGARPPNYGGRGGVFVPPNPVSFVLSASELDWTLRGVPPWYSIDSRAGDRPATGGPSRTGGWGWLFVLLNGFALALQALNLRRESDPMQRSLVVTTMALILLTAVLPRSHELRYWLFLPLIFLPVNLRYIARSASPLLLGGALSSAMVYALAQTLFTPGTQLITERWPIRGAPPLPAEIAGALQRNGRFCSTDTLLFRYSPAVTGVRGILSLRPEDCAGDRAGNLPAA